MASGAAYNMPSIHRASSPYSLPQHSPWHSPVPYLFGGLAAMLGLIAFALLILACSYWKLSGYLENSLENNNNNNNRNQTENRDLETGEMNPEIKLPKVMQEKLLVIMAGDVDPTFLATPVLGFGTLNRDSSASSSRSSSFGDGYKTCTCDLEKIKDEDEDGTESRDG